MNTTRRQLKKGELLMFLCIILLFKVKPFYSKTHLRQNTRMQQDLMIFCGSLDGELNADPTKVQLTVPPPKAAEVYYTVCINIDQHKQD
jgi:hypothetical protein